MYTFLYVIIKSWCLSRRQQGSKKHQLKNCLVINSKLTYLDMWKTL